MSKNKFFLIEGKKFVEAVKPLCNIFGKDGTLYIEADKESNTVTINAFGKSGGFFFESKVLNLSGEEESINESFEACVGKVAALHLNRLFSDTKLKTFKVSVGASSLKLAPISVHDRGEVGQVFLNYNINIPLLSTLPVSDINTVKKLVKDYLSKNSVKIPGVALKDSFLVTSACASPPGSKSSSFLEAVFLVIEKDSTINFIGTDGFKLAEYKSNFGEIPKDLVGEYAIGYRLATFLSKHLDQEQDVGFLLSKKYAVFGFGEEDKTIIGGVLLKHDLPDYRKYMVKKDRKSYTVDKALFNQTINAIHSVYEDLYNRGGIKVDKGVMTLYNPLKPQDKVSGIPVDYSGTFDGNYNFGNLSTILRIFRGSNSITVHFVEDNNDEHILLESVEDENITAFLIPLS